MSVPPKIDLSALHRLQFYRNKKDWKLCSELRSDDVKKKADEAQDEKPLAAPSSAAHQDTGTDKNQEESEFKSTPANNLFARSRTYINTSSKTSDSSSSKIASATSVVIKKSRVRPRLSSRKASVLVSKQKLLRANNATENSPESVIEESLNNEENLIKSNGKTCAVKTEDDNDVDLNNVKDCSFNKDVVVSRNTGFKVIIPGIEIDKNTRKAQRVKNEIDTKTKDNRTKKGTSTVTSKRNVNINKNMKDTERNTESSTNATMKTDNVRDIFERHFSHKLRGKHQHTPVSQSLLKSFNQSKQKTEDSQLKISEDKKYFESNTETANDNGTKSFLPINEEDIITAKPTYDARDSKVPGKGLPLEIDKAKDGDLLQDIHKEKVDGGIISKKPVRTHNLPIYAKLSQDEMMLEELIEAHNQITRRLKKNLIQQDKEIDHDDYKSDTDVEEIASRLAKMNVKVQQQSRDAYNKQVADFDENAMYEQEFAVDGYGMWNTDDISSSGHKECDVDKDGREEQEWNAGHKNQWSDKLLEETQRGRPQHATPWMQNWSNNAGEEVFFNRKPYDQHFEEYPTRDVGLNEPQHTPPIDIGQGPRQVPSTNVFEHQGRPPSVIQASLDQRGPQVNVPPFDPHREPNYSPAPQSNNSHGLPSRKSMPFETRCGPQSNVTSQSFDPRLGPHSLPSTLKNNNRLRDQMSFDPYVGPQELLPGPQCNLNSFQQIPPFNDQNRTLRSSTPLDDSCYGSASFMQSPSHGPPNVPPPSPEHYEPEFVPPMSSFGPSCFDSTRDPPSMFQIPPFDPHRPPPNYPPTPFDKRGLPNLISSPLVNESRDDFFNNPRQSPFDPLCGHHSISPVPFDPNNGPLETPPFSTDSQSKNLNRFNENESQNLIPTNCNENLYVQGNFNRNNFKEAPQNKKNNSKNSGKNENTLLKFIQDFNNKFINDEKEKELIENNLLKRDFNKETGRVNNNNNDCCDNKNACFGKESTSNNNMNVQSVNLSRKQQPITNKNDNYSLKDIPTANNRVPKNDEALSKYNHKPETIISSTYFAQENAQRQTNSYYNDDKAQFAENTNRYMQKDVPLSKNNNPNFVKDLKTDAKLNYHLQQDIPKEIDYYAQKEFPVSSTQCFAQKDTFVSSNDYPIIAEKDILNPNNSSMQNRVPLTEFNYISSEVMTIPNSAINFDSEAGQEARYLAQKQVHVSTNAYVAQNAVPMANENYYYEQKDIPNTNNNANEQTDDSNNRYNYQPNFIQNINIITQKNVSNNIEANIKPVVFSSCVRCDQYGVPTEGGRGRGRLKTEARNLGPQQFYQI